MPWILNVFYVLLLVAVSPVILYRMLRQGKYRVGWKQKFLGLLPQRVSTGECIWFHAVSVGEVLQLQNVIGELEAKHADCEFVISTTTTTGHGVARQQFPKHTVCYLPLDFSWAVKRAIDRIRPTLIVLVELELWPNFILAASKRKLPIALINGRISEHSFRGYQRIRPLIGGLLKRFTAIAVQNETYASRFIKLGAAQGRLQVTGSIKFDRIETDRENSRTAELRRAFGLGDNERVFIAGSTQSPEEEYAIDAWLELRSQHPDVRLILVPRHKERFEEVAHLVHNRRLPLIRRSQESSADDGTVESGLAPANPRSEIPPVLLLDTLGELSACWGLADIAFVGGSLTNRGGQNMIEPAAYGATLLFGPNTQNFRDVVDELLSSDAACVVTDKEDLASRLLYFLEHPHAARRQGQRAQTVVLSQQGATQRTVSMIETARAA